MTFRALIIRAAGTNCDGETVAALEAAGAAVDALHVNRVIREPQVLDRYRLLVFAGGFTYGDDVASGAVFAYVLAKRLHEPLDRFVGSGRAVLGICNGFQILVRLGFLPGRGGRASLLWNLSGRFEGRWVRMRSGKTPGAWLEPETEYLFPVAHAEGRFEWFPDREGAPFPEDQVALRYTAAGVESTGVTAGYPANPNGSFQDIAGIVNPDGNVLGLMPHPERFITPYHHPHWPSLRRDDRSPPSADDLGVPLGLDLFRRIIRHGV